MDIYAVKDELATVLKTITGLRAYAWAQGAVSAPAALPGWPDRVEYVGTYGRGQSHVPDLPLLVLVGKASERVAAKRLGEYVAESGAKSIPLKLESRAGSWTTCDVVTVSWVGFPAVAVAGVDYLAAEFHLDIIGKGA
jgi:hypothetical protein